MIRSVTRLLIAALLCQASCGAPVEVLPEQNLAPASDGYRLLTRFVQISDVQVLDEESPGRLAPADVLVSVAWRPHEAYTTQVLDGTLRAVNRRHEQGQTFDFVIHTGDATDNNQENEWRWFLDVMDGLPVDPLSGVDDRPAAQRPPPVQDPHAAFQARGLYRRDVHGPEPSIPWYAVLGNHDRFALGVFPIFEFAPQWRVAPLPPANRFFFPALLNPVGHVTHGLISPANPGPPQLLSFARWVPANPQRRFLRSEEIIALHGETLSDPPGHGFEAGGIRSWYSAAPVAELRLIVLDTALPGVVIPQLPYDSGALTVEQAEFLEAELQEADRRGEWVVVATHHPSADLGQPGTPLRGAALRDLLSGHPSVVLHLAGHTHRHRVIRRDGYLEIETGSLIDYPQEARWIEIWVGDDDQAPEVRYDVFSHLEVTDDALSDLRAEAYALALADAPARRPDAVPAAEIDAPAMELDPSRGAVLLHRPSAAVEERAAE